MSKAFIHNATYSAQLSSMSVTHFQPIVAVPYGFAVVVASSLSGLRFQKTTAPLLAGRSSGESQKGSDVPPAVIALVRCRHDLCGCAEDVPANHRLRRGIHRLSRNQPGLTQREDEGQTVIVLFRQKRQVLVVHYHLCVLFCY